VSSHRQVTKSCSCTICPELYLNNIVYIRHLFHNGTNLEISDLEQTMRLSSESSMHSHFATKVLAQALAQDQALTKESVKACVKSIVKYIDDDVSESSSFQEQLNIKKSTSLLRHLLLNSKWGILTAHLLMMKVKVIIYIYTYA
jgi:hypothetical protein